MFVQLKKRNTKINQTEACTKSALLALAAHLVAELRWNFFKILRSPPSTKIKIPFIFYKTLFAAKCTVLPPSGGALNSALFINLTCSWVIANLEAGASCAHMWMDAKVRVCVLAIIVAKIERALGSAGRPWHIYWLELSEAAIFVEGWTAFPSLLSILGRPRQRRFFQQVTQIFFFFFARKILPRPLFLPLH